MSASCDYISADSNASYSMLLSLRQCCVHCGSATLFTNTRKRPCRIFRWAFVVCFFAFWCRHTAMPNVIVQYISSSGTSASRYILTCATAEYRLMQNHVRSRRRPCLSSLSAHRLSRFETGQRAPSVPRSTVSHYFQDHWLRYLHLGFPQWHSQSLWKSWVQCSGGCVSQGSR